jgi:hypothetical protein
MAEITLEDVAQSVASLTEAVTEMRERSADAPDPLDREKVETIAAEVLERQRAAAPEANRRHGFEVEDVEGADKPQLSGGYRQRMAEVHSRSAKQVAPLMRGVSETDIREFQRRSDILTIVSTALDVNPRDADRARQPRPAGRAAVRRHRPDAHEPVRHPGPRRPRQRIGKHAENTADTGQTGFSKRTPGRARSR